MSRPGVFHHLSFLLLFSSISISTAYAATSLKTDLNTKLDSDEKVEWLKDNISSVQSMTFLKKAIGNSRIVLLGEEHDDGSTFLLKTRFVKFLHEKMGFDIIAWEADLYDCDIAWKYLKAGESGRSAAKRCMDQLWTDSAQVQELYQYLEAQSKTSHPLKLIGLDMHTTGSASREFFIDDFQKYLAQSNSAFLTSSAWPEFKSMLSDLTLESPTWIPDAEKQNFFIATVNELTEHAHLYALKTRTNSARSWTQYIQNLAAAAKFNWAKNALMPFTIQTDISSVQPIRDAEMANNLLWFATKIYPKKKMIVWMNTGHIARVFDQEHEQLVHPEIFPFVFPRSHYQTMGGIVSPTLKNKMYSIGFTAYSGMLGNFGTNPWSTRPITSPDPISAGSFEDLAHQAGIQTGFLNLRALRSSPDNWLNSSIIARPFGFVEMKMKLPEVFDGLVFFDEMQPSTQIP